MDRTDTVTMERPITGTVTVTTTLLPTITCMFQKEEATLVLLIAMAGIEPGIVAGNLYSLLSIREQIMILKNNFKKRFAWCLAILGTSTVFLKNALAQPGSFSNWHMGRWMMGDWEMGWFGMMMMFLFWGLVIVGIVSLIRWLMQSTGSRGYSGVSADSQAMSILKERFAKGELTRDEFESMKKEILQ